MIYMNTWIWCIKNKYEKIYVIDAKKTLDEILTHLAFQAKDDKELTRVNQYKQLENKTNARKNASSNLDFLRSINIQVQIFDCVPRLLDRTYEMIDRSNQLNFTKIRLTKEELKDLLEDESVTCKCVRVHDDFGDSGIVGFYALKDCELIHFVFSCRIINMGVEQWVYVFAIGACDMWRMMDHLSTPNMNIVYECNTFHVRL